MLPLLILPPIPLIPWPVLGAVTPKAEGFNYSKNSIALFRLTGDLAAEPEDTSGAADPWKETDGFIRYRRVQVHPPR